MVVKGSLIKDASEDRVFLLLQEKFEAMFGNEKNKNVLKLSQRLAYAVGHVLNDICAAIWFSYALLFFEVVLKMPSTLTGVVIFIGQLADAVASPILGIFVDRYGTRKSWHMFGTALIAFSFSLFFSKCPWGPDYSLEYNEYNNITDNFQLTNLSSWRTTTTTPTSMDVFLGILYYIILVIIFQTGWATVQIAHLAIIPDIALDKSGRADLTAVRYTATICSSVFVYLITWFILRVTDAASESIGPEDFPKFKDVVVIGLLTGGTFTMLFHAILETPNKTSNTSESVISKTASAQFAVIKEYFKSWPLYQVSILYFSSKMLLNISLMYMPLYLLEIVGNETEYIATVPLVSYIASFLASLGVRQVRSFCSSKISYLIGALVSIGACIWIGIGLRYTGELFGISVLLGAGSSITGIASLCLCADLIGTDTQNGAFVYSIVTSGDRLLGGVVVILIEDLKCKVGESSHYYQDVLTYGCGISALFGLLTLFTMYSNSSKTLIDELSQETTESTSP